MKKFLFAGFIGLLFAFASCGFESGSIYGNVTLDNEAVEGATVKLYYEEGSSDEDVLWMIYDELDSYKRDSENKKTIHSFVI